MAGAPLNLGPRYLRCLASPGGKEPLRLYHICALVPNWARRVPEAPGQQPGRFWAATAKGGAALPAPGPHGQPFSPPSHPREGEHHGFGWGHRVVPGWKGGFLLCFFFFFSLGTLCNCSEIPPSPNALGHGKRQGQSRLHELGRSRQRNGQRPPKPGRALPNISPSTVLQPPGMEDPPRDQPNRLPRLSPVPFCTK